jgi:hypothetical protein
MYRWDLTNGKMWSKQKRCEAIFQKKYGMIYTCKSYGMEENILLQVGI